MCGGGSLLSTYPKSLLHIVWAHVYSLAHSNYYEELSTLAIVVVAIMWFSQVSHTDTGAIACTLRSSIPPIHIHEHLLWSFQFQEVNNILSMAASLLFEKLRIKFCLYSGLRMAHVVCDKKRHTNFLHQIAATRITRFRIKLFFLCAFDGFLYGCVYRLCYCLLQTYNISDAKQIQIKYAQFIYDLCLFIIWPLYTMSTLPMRSTDYFAPYSSRPCSKGISHTTEYQKKWKFSHLIYANRTKGTLLCLCLFFINVNDGRVDRVVYPSAYYIDCRYYLLAVIFNSASSREFLSI